MHHGSVKNPAVKRPVPSDPLDNLAIKRQRLVDQRLQPLPPLNGLSNSKGGQDHTPPPLNPHLHAKTEFQRTTPVNHVGNQNDFPVSQNGLLPMHKLSSSSDARVSERGELGPDTSVQQKVQDDLADCKHQQVANCLHRKKKSKKHKDKERERLKEEGVELLETSPDLKQNPDKLDDPDIEKAVSCVEEKPDYILTYSAITSTEQRHRYQDDFTAEYSEYKDIHFRIATITHMFVLLGSKIKSLSPGTQEYKIMEDQILEKYKKYRKKFPDYREEKKRCEYLHQKLSHIKQLLTDYDLEQPSS